MKKFRRLLGVILSLSLMPQFTLANADLYEIPAQEEFDTGETVYETELPYSLFDLEGLEDSIKPQSAQATNSTGYTVDKWNDLYSKNFGSAFCEPSTINNSAISIDNNNRLTIRETDLTIPGRGVLT